MTQKDVLLSWLRDAYAMEQAQVRTLGEHAQEAGDNAGLREKLEEHLEVTRRHADTVRDCLARLGGEPPDADAGASQGFLQSVSTDAAGDRRVKNAMTDYGMESFEIICYKALAEAAAAIGEHDMVPLFEGIMDDEEDMAAWLEQNLPLIIEEYFSQQVAA